MQTLQDLETGKIWNFLDDLDIKAIPHLPPSLSSEVVFPPSDAHYWQSGSWLIDPNKAHADLVAQAKTALDKLTGSSGTVMRCYMAGIPFPTDWQAYRAELLAIANGTDTKSTVLPTQPAYPAGT